MNSSEERQGSFKVVDVCQERREISIKEKSIVAAPSKIFHYDRVFGPQSKQIEVYKAVVAPLLEEVLMGYNCTVFAYGQTGTGKTFTMEGERSEECQMSWEADSLAGIIPRAMHQLFDRLQKQVNENSIEFSVRVSYPEIYNEELIDLLGGLDFHSLRLKIYEDRKGSCVIQGLEEVIVHNKSEVYSILEQGSTKRQTAATLMNAHSSRSHTVFMVTVHIKENSVDGEELLKTGKLNLVDLAGSECIGRSGAVNQRAREAGNINQSLLTLGRVITALVEHAPHVPYRESKLTRLLQDSLGGRTKTSIIATISPASCNTEETLSTLDYAFRAKNITNRPEVNQKLTKKALLKEYTEELQRLRKDLQAAQEKRGIFLGEDNYNEMISKMAQRKDLIRDLEERIKIVTDDMEKLNELFGETKEQLETTERVLADTKTTLYHTRLDRDEQHHLVNEYTKVENQLHSEASELLSAVAKATTDVSGLHAKLDRKCSIESHNAACEETFQQQFAQHISSMQDHVSQLQREHSSRCHQQMQQLESALSSRNCELNQQMTALDKLVQTLRAKISDIEELEKNVVTAAQKWTEEFSQFTQQYKNLTSECAAHVAQLQKMATEQHEQFCCHVNQQQQAAENQQDSISDWSASMSADLTARNQDVKHFFMRDLRRDMPTGTTPQRQDFHYPCTLTRMAQHDQLLKAFREDRLVQEAANTPVPDTSIDSVKGEPSALESQLEVLNKASQASDDSALSLDCSAISQNSAINQSPVENKTEMKVDNKVMQPPVDRKPRFPSKSRNLQRTRSPTPVSSSQRSNTKPRTRLPLKMTQNI